MRKLARPCINSLLPWGGFPCNDLPLAWDSTYPMTLLWGYYLHLAPTKSPAELRYRCTLSFVIIRQRQCRDEESPYLSAKGPASGGPPSAGQRVMKELKQNWWLWASVVFAVVLLSGLLLFRNQLYDSATHGLPFLAGEPNCNIVHAFDGEDE